MASPASSDEGEIVESGVEDLKATSLPKKFQGNGVDRQDRHRNRYSASKSPDYDDKANNDDDDHPRHGSRRSRSPRGFKRSRDDRDFRNGGRRVEDPRHF